MTSRWFAGRLCTGIALCLSTLAFGSPGGVAAAGYDARADVVQISSGLVAATRDSGPDIRTFKAIPFAAPPIGDVRCQPPQPVGVWNGVRRSDSFSPKCMQGPSELRFIFYQNSEVASEDCLYLNVWTGASSPSERRPVMVFVHGGANMAGSGSQATFTGQGLAAKGAVVVTFNYRLGPFGFLAHPELTQESPDQTSGNYGLLDQIAALRWVQTNIAAFGGDPANVTLYGESAGAQDASVLLASPPARGLFQRVIAESSAAFLAYPTGAKNPTLAEAEQAGIAFATAANASSLAELRARPAQDLVAVPGAWGPIVDGYVFPDQLDRLFANKQAADVPLLVGWNADEGTPFPPFAVTLADFQDKAQRIYGSQAAQFLALYPVASDADAQTQAFAPFGQGALAWEAYTLARAHQASGQSRTFVYYFTQVPPWYPDQHFLGLDPPSNFGAYHSVEQPYFYNNLDTLPRPYTSVDRMLSDVTSAFLVNFATSGDPNAGPRTGLPNWPAYAATGGRVMYLGQQIEPGSVPFQSAFDFFDAVYMQRLGRPPLF